MRSRCLAEMLRVSRGAGCEADRREEFDAGKSRSIRSFTSFRMTTVGRFGGRTASVMCRLLALLVVGMVSPAIAADAVSAPVDAEPALSWRLDSISSELLSP